MKSYIFQVLPAVLMEESNVDVECDTALLLRDMPEFVNDASPHAPVKRKHHCSGQIESPAGWWHACRGGKRQTDIAQSDVLSDRSTTTVTALLTRSHYVILSELHDKYFDYMV